MLGLKRKDERLIRIRMKVGHAGVDFRRDPGEVLELPRREAEGEIASGRAELAPPDASLGRPRSLMLSCSRCGSSPTLEPYPFCALCLSMLRGGRR
jgi:hypothetical protein